MNLLTTFTKYNEKTLNLLDPHCKLILNLLENEKDKSLKNLALQVLPIISSKENLNNTLLSLKRQINK